MSIIIAGIHTGIGKTICSAVLCQLLGYDYWKPVQAGDLENSDSHFIRDHVDHPSCVIHPESYRLSTAASPHYAAEQDSVIIEKHKILLPFSSNDIVIETAGGLMSPLGKKFLNIDLIQHLAFPVILVSNNYLGSINHSLLSCEALKIRNIPVCGIVFTGEKNRVSEKYILNYTGFPLLFSIPWFENLGSESIRKFAGTLHLDILINRL